MKRLVAIVLSAIMAVSMISAVAASEAPDGYTQVKVFDGTYGFGDAEITAFSNDDFSNFYLTFESFDEEQILEGTVSDGIVTVTYDETGFMSGEAQFLWDDAVASDAAWAAVGGEPAEAAAVVDVDVPEGYTQVKVFDGTYGFGDAEITAFSNDDFSNFYLTFESFDEEQILEGTVSDGIVTVTYDETGFMSGEAQFLWDDAVASDAAWAAVGGAAPAGEAAVAEEIPMEDQPFYIQGGIWEDNFTRSNDNLNGLADDINDEKLDEYKKTEAQNKGTVVPLTYETYFYALDMANGDVSSHETPITKQAFVYLPYGYDETQQYNVLYLYHGGSATEYMWFKQNDSLNDEDVDNSEVGKGYAVNILDHAFEDGLNDPFIVVTPTLYYPEATEEQNEAAGDYMTTTISYDLRDLIPVVESTYSTYAEDVTPEGLIASRDHRAMAGLSMGSMATFDSGLVQSQDIISWFGCMSAGPGGEGFIQDKLIPAIEAAAENGWKLNMLLNLDGFKDMAFEGHKAAHEALLAYAETSDNLNVGENYDFVVSNGRHMFSAWNLYLYDMIQVFFK